MNNLVSFQAKIKIESPEGRGLIVGKGGMTLRRLRENTGCRIFVPHAQHQHQRHRHRLNETVGSQSRYEQGLPVNLPNATHESNHEDHCVEQHPVRVNTFDLSNHLHSFHEISCILSQGNAHYLEDGVMSGVPIITTSTTLMAACTVKIRTNHGKQSLSSKEIVVNGQLYNRGEQSHDNGLLFGGTVLSPLPSDHCRNVASSLTSSSFPTNWANNQTTLNEGDITMVVDNLWFVNSSVTKLCQWFCRDSIDDDGGDYGKSMPVSWFCGRCMHYISSRLEIWVESAT